MAFATAIPFPRPGADEVGFELGNHPQHVEQQLPYRIVRVVDAPAQVEGNPFTGQFVREVPGVGQRPSKAIKLGDYRGVTIAAGCQGLTKPWA